MDAEIQGLEAVALSGGIAGAMPAAASVPWRLGWRLRGLARPPRDVAVQARTCGQRERGRRDAERGDERSRGEAVDSPHVTEGTSSGDSGYDAVRSRLAEAPRGETVAPPPRRRRRGLEQLKASAIRGGDR